MGRIAELRVAVQRRTGNIYDTLFTRRVSIYLTWALSFTPMTPNQVSVVNLINGIAAAALIGLGDRPWVLVGLGLVHLYAVLDSVDGELARLRRQFSSAGLFLEDFSAYTMINALWLAYASYLYRFHQLNWPLWFAVGYAAFGRNGMPVARRALLQKLGRGESVAVPGAAPAVVGAAEGGVASFVRESVLHLTNIWMMMTLWVAIDVVWAPSVVVAAWAFGFYSMGLALKEAAVVGRYLFTDRLDREHASLAAATQGSATPGSATQGSATPGSATQGSATQGSATPGSAQDDAALVTTPSREKSGQSNDGSSSKP